LETACPHAVESTKQTKKGLKAGRLQNFAAQNRALARKISVPLISANERPARFLPQDQQARRLLSETTETVVFRFQSTSPASASILFHSSPPLVASSRI